MDIDPDSDNIPDDGALEDSNDEDYSRTTTTRTKSDDEIIQMRLQKKTSLAITPHHQTFTHAILKTS